MALKKVESFHGEYRFLSNFYPAIVEFDRILYPTAEHAYQAAKSTDPKVRAEIAQCATPGAAKRMGKLITIRPNWDGQKLTVMTVILGDKFRRHPDLAKKLLDTWPAELVEGNLWGDVYWGVCKGKGENHLGKILMALRDYLSEEEAIERGG